MMFLWCFYGVSMVFIWCFYGVSMVSGTCAAWVWRCDVLQCSAVLCLCASCVPWCASASIHTHTHTTHTHTTHTYTHTHTHSEFARVMSPSSDAKMVFLTDSRNLELLCSAVASLNSCGPSLNSCDPVNGGNPAAPAAVNSGYNGGNWFVTAIRSFALSPETTGLSSSAFSAPLPFIRVSLCPCTTHTTYIHTSTTHTC